MKRGWIVGDKPTVMDPHMTVNDSRENVAARAAACARTP
jgi:hypothetical protein